MAKRNSALAGKDKKWAGAPMMSFPRLSADKEAGHQFPVIPPLSPAFFFQREKQNFQFTTWHYSVLPMSSLHECSTEYHFLLLCLTDETRDIKFQERQSVCAVIDLD